MILLCSNKFLEAELLFPQSDWAPKSALMAAYSYYLQDYYSKSIFHLERFIQLIQKIKECHMLIICWQCVIMKILRMKREIYYLC